MRNRKDLQVTKSQNFLVSTTLVLLLGIIGVRNYGFSDDYSFVLYFNSKDNPLYEVLIGNGRPLYFLISEIQFTFIDSIGDFWLLHSISYLLLLLILNEMFKLLDHSNLNPLEKSLLVYAPVLASPAFLLFVNWIQLFPALCGIYISLFSLRKLLTERKRFKQACFSMLLGVPFLIYQPVGLFALVFFGVIFSFGGFKSSSELEIRPALSILNVFAFSCSPIVSLGLIKVGKDLGWVSGERSNFVGDLNSKLEWLGDEYWRSSNTFFTPFTSIPPLISLMMFTLALFLGLKSHANRLERKILVLIPLILLTILPSFLTAQNWAGFRAVVLTQIAIALIYTYLLILLSRRIDSRYSKSGIGLILAILLVVSQYSLNSFWHVPNKVELAKARESISKVDCLNVRYFKTANWSQTISGKVFYDEYSLPSSVQPWAARGLVILICKEKGVSVENLTQLELEPNSPDTTVEILQVVDFQTILEQNFSGKE